MWSVEPPEGFPRDARYEFVRYVGRGGAGKVYEVFDRQLGRVVALKTLANFTPAAVHQLKREFRTLADVHHPSLVRLYELVSTSEGMTFFTMEFVRGVHFDRYVRRSCPAPALSLEMRGIPTVRPGECGRNFDPPLPQSPSNIPRLREALLGLVRGLRALHASGRLHRDIKPQNVLVTEAGRVVLLDFGIATRVVPEDHDESVVVGTPEYMAPEQACAMLPEPTHDWYSVGALLFRVLVGRPPFVGSFQSVVASKTTSDASRPSTLVAGVPNDLDELCCALLDRDPKRRPTGGDILRALGTAPSLRPFQARAEGPRGVRPALVGRADELRVLERAFLSVLHGQSAAVRVSGSSGMGKSTLVQRFVDELAGNQRAIVLRAHVHEHERIPYKAIDGAIDSLTGCLLSRERNGDRVRASVNSRALACLFPVLGSISAVSTLPEHANRDPMRTRELAFKGLGELVREASRGKPVVLAIDDAQWGDADSVALLLEMVRPPAPVPLLVILSHRDGDLGASSFLSDLLRRWPPAVPMSEVALGPLDLCDSRALVLRELGSETESALAIADFIARESAGNPFLAQALAYGAKNAISSPQQSGDGDSRAGVQRLVEARVADLGDEAHRVLELAAVSGRPVAVEIVAAAAGVRDLESTIGVLGDRKLIRLVQQDGHELLATSHDRIRDAVATALSADTLREHHERLALAFDATSSADVEARVTHWLGAGNPREAGRAAKAAAEQAAQKLAFRRAEEFYRIALSALPNATRERTRLYRRLAEVLEWDGRGMAAANVYLEGARDTTGIERSEFESSAAMQLLCSGHVEEGSSVLQRSLQSLGLRSPRNAWSAVLGLVVNRVRLSLIIDRCEKRGSSEATEEANARIEALYAAAFGTTFVNPVIAESIQSQHILLALREGGLLARVRALAIEGSHRMKQPGARSAERGNALLARAAALCEQGEDADALAFVQACRGVSHFLRGDFRDAHGLLDQAYADMPRHVAGWHSNAQIYNVFSLVGMGEFQKLSERLPGLLRDAEERDDHFTLSALRVGAQAPLLLAEDRADLAREVLETVTAADRSPHYVLAHWRAMCWQVEVELYSGQFAAAFARFAEDERPLRRSLLLSVAYIRATTEFLRARCALANRALDRTRRMRDVRRGVRALERMKLRWTSVLAAMLKAALSLEEGQRNHAIRFLRDAVELAEENNMFGHAEASRLHLGNLLACDEGWELAARAERRLADRGVRAPSRFAAMLLPLPVEAVEAEPQGDR